MPLPLYRVLSGLYSLEVNEDRFHFYTDEITSEVGLHENDVERALRRLHALGKIDSGEMGLATAHRINHSLPIAQVNQRNDIMNMLPKTPELEEAISDGQFSPRILDDEREAIQVARSLIDVETAGERAVFIREGEPLGELSLEIAATPRERQRGLASRDSLESGHGLLFIYPKEKPRSMWMKGISIPLDIIFLDSGWRIQNVVQADPQPLASDAELRRYRSAGPAKFVIETTQGFADRLSLVPGTEVRYNGTPIEAVA